ncbi:hypothetical protein MKX08_003382 [Trichoderma sp. CBMAI-0020]|nr:hypothetical protein MKX08_003382 [Trichoderma sp. CBMAI-0020]WOD46399.1 hypothetical protein [Trichoderma atroviride]
MDISKVSWFDATITLLVAITVNLLYNFLLFSIRSSRATKTPVQKPFAPQKFLTLRISNIPCIPGVTADSLRQILSNLPIAAQGTGSQPNLLEFSYSPTAVSAFSSRYVVATATFELAPAIGELEMVLKQKLGAEAGHLKVDRDFLGITPLSDGDNAHADIIAVTGLAGHAFGSWKSKNMPHMWLRDFLPQSVVNARILTYGYDTKIYGSQSEESILELAKALLESIKTTRRKNIRNRPIIFIAHSLGGLVVKEALVQASVGSEEDQTIYRSCYALFLFGVPNRGLNNLSLKSMVKGQPNESLVRDLGESSRFLSLLHERFNACFTFDDSHILSISETKHTATVEWNSETGTWERTGPEVMMVGHTSATNAHQNEKTYNRLSINSDHSEMVKFSDISNPDYLNIQSRLVDLVNSAPTAIRERFDHHTRKITQLERQFLRNLKAPDSEAFRNDKVGDRTPGTLNWFLRNDLYRDWESADSSSSLWIQGSPGQGKTMLAKFILDTLEESVPSSEIPSAVIYFFFYDQDESYRTSGAAMRSLIKQLLNLAPDSFQIVTQTFDIESSDISDNSLRDILKDLLQMSQLSIIYCVIDGLDECQNDGSRKMLLDLITSNHRQTSTRRKRSVPTLKTILTSRPTVDIHGELYHLPNIQLKANHEDLEIFIKNKVHDLRFHEDLKQKAIHLLSSRVEQTFLWISIVLKRLKVATPLLSEAGMEEMINESPSDLEKLFENIINRIKEAKDMTAQKLLIWAVYGRRPLTLAELQEAIAVQDDSTSKGSTKKYSVALTESGVTTATGVILEIVDGKIHLVHQSAKDYLLKSGHLAEFAFCMSLHPSSYLAKVCMTYLCFTDIVESGSCRNGESLNKRNIQHPFLQYAARNWYRHLEQKDDINRFARLISQLTEPQSPALLTWGAVNGIINLKEATDTWEVALKVNIPWLVDLQIDSTVITKDMIGKATANGMTEYDYLRWLVKKHDSLFTEEELCLVVEYLDHALVRQILSGQTRAVITQNIFEAAAKNVKYGRLVVEAILELSICFIITVNFINSAQKNDVNGRDIIRIVVDNHNMEITGEAVQRIVESGDVELVKLLFKREQLDGLQLALGAAAKQGNYELLMLVLDKGGDKLTITERYMQDLVNSSPPDALKSFLRAHKQKARITESIVIDTANHKKKREYLLLFFLKERGDNFQITEELLKAIIQNEDAENEALQFLFAERNHEVHMTEDIWRAAAANSVPGAGTILLLLSMRSHELHISEEILRSAAENVWCGQKIMTTFLGLKGHDSQIAEAILKAAIRGNFTKDGVVGVFTQAQRSDIRFDAEEMVKTAARYGKREYAMAALFEVLKDEIQVTEEVIKEAARNDFRYSHRIMAFLLDTTGDEAQITEDVLIEATRNLYGFVILRVIFKKAGHKIRITEKVLKAITEMETDKSELAELKFTRNGNPTNMIEEVLIKAAIIGNSWQSLTWILHTHGDKMKITEDILKLAAGSKFSFQILSIISKFKGGDIQVTDAMIMSKEQLECWDSPEKYLSPLSSSPGFVEDSEWRKEINVG